MKTVIPAYPGFFNIDCVDRPFDNEDPALVESWVCLSPIVAWIVDEEEGLQSVIPGLDSVATIEQTVVLRPDGKVACCYATYPNLASYVSDRIFRSGLAKSAEDLPPFYEEPTP